MLRISQHILITVLVWLHMLNVQSQNMYVDSIDAKAMNPWQFGARVTVNRNAFHENSQFQYNDNHGELRWTTGFDARILVSRSVFSNVATRLSIELEAGYSRFDGKAYGVSRVTGPQTGYFVLLGYEEFHALSAGLGVEYLFSIRNQMLAMSGGLELNRLMNNIVWDYADYSKRVVPKINLQLRYVFDDQIPLLYALYLTCNQTFTRTRKPERQNGYYSVGLGLMIRL